MYIVYTTFYLACIIVSLIGFVYLIFVLAYYTVCLKRQLIKCYLSAVVLRVAESCLGILESVMETLMKLHSNQILYIIYNYA